MCFTYMILLLSTGEVGIIIFTLQMSKRKLNEVAEGPIGREWLGWDFRSGSDAQSPRFSLDITVHQSVVNDPPTSESPGELIKMHAPRFHPRPTDSESQENADGKLNFQ